MDNIYSKILEETEKGKKVVLVTSFSESGTDIGFRNKVMITEKDLESANNLKLKNNSILQDLPICTDAILKEIRLTLESGKVKVLRLNDFGTVLIEPYYGMPKLIILGGGHIAKCLVDISAKLGFSITVVDDRPRFANKDRFPGAAAVICDGFENCWSKINPDVRSFVVITTRGHRHDLICMRHILNYNVAYLGMVSSRSRADNLRKQLMGEGYDRKKLEKVFAPIGIAIGAQTPEEIAVSIIAEIISVIRLGKRIPGETNDCITASWSTHNRAIMLHLAQQHDDPKALVTIIATTGSVPRKVGSKMLVWRDGRTMGSIGGGCLEAKVTATARDIMEQGGFGIYRADMNDVLAADEGMACGGSIEVIIELV